ncbi:PREDICTED: follicle cell protein 3C-1-like [Nicrophorus vespilloides]|uniref:Follicle cell protein 3C-1-like n=1 Tax=Nicrophorus vespilloides TaxID=110193 RepID=A0ABM1NC71_NICVS|nr:PREDICTED: follicle cell protein 3C-1-like [Nicrophorus vespilloides]
MKNPMKAVVLTVILMMCVKNLMSSPLTPVVTTSATNTGKKCECGAFEGKKVTGNAQPILAQNPLNVTCDADGKKMCRTICTDLAKMSVERGPAVLCAKINHAEAIKPSLFTRICEGEWEYGDFGVEEPICCHEGKSISCKKEKKP